MSEPLAYFLTWTTSGAWLHGDERGSKDRNRNGFGDPDVPADAGLNRYRKFQLGERRFALDSSERRAAVRNAINSTCELSAWTLWAMNVRTNHVHLVVSANPSPEQVLSSVKAWATKELVARGLVERGSKIWTRHGSTRYLWNDEDLAAAITYTVEGQGADLD